jgi:tetratricopeptide (TPR) repeat protein
MESRQIQALLADLQRDDEDVRERATELLWQSWFEQKGIYGLKLLTHSQELISQGMFAEAEALLSEIIHDQPDFTEAWNRRAVLHYQQKNYRQALTDCEQVLRLVPYHFGALHGLGLCYAALADYGQAIQAFRRALEVQPHALLNQRLLLECTARLPS